MPTKRTHRPFRRNTVLPRDAKPIAAKFDIRDRAARARRGSAALLRAELRLHVRNGTLPPHFDLARFTAACRAVGVSMAMLGGARPA